MEKELKPFKYSPAYISSVATVFILISLLQIISALTLKHLLALNFSTVGAWFSCIGFIIFGWTWGNPIQIPTFAGSGIDVHPEDKDKQLGERILIGTEYRRFSLWLQPNRLNLMIAVFTLFIASFLQAIGATFTI